MAKASFAGGKKQAASPEPAKKEQPSEQIVKRQDQTVATTGGRLPISDDMSGSWLYGDVRLPRINLIQKSSDAELIQTFGLGSFAFAKTVKLSDGVEPVIITAVRMQKDYQQKVEFGSDITPVVYLTPEEVKANGGSLDYADFKKGNYFQPRAHVQIILAAPDDLDDENEAYFPHEYKGKAYGIGLMTIASSAFTSMGKELATFRQFNKTMKQGLRFGSLALTAAPRKKDAKQWHVPIVKFLAANPPALVEFFESIM